MKFESVYKIDKLLKDRKENTFIKEKELEKLNKSPEEYKLLYFLRKSFNKIFHDSPVLGGMESRLINSFIEGPFPSPPKVKKAELYEEYSEKIIKRFVPADKVPVAFKKVELRKYGLEIQPDDFHILKYIDKDQVRKIGESSLKKLEDISRNLEKVPVDKHDPREIYRALIDCFVVEFSHVNGFYPSTNLQVFGMENKTQEIIEKLDLYRLRAVFRDSYYIEFGLEDNVQKGLAYDLSLKDLDIEKISELENIIL